MSTDNVSRLVQSVLRRPWFGLRSAISSGPDMLALLQGVGGSRSVPRWPVAADCACVCSLLMQPCFFLSTCPVAVSSCCKSAVRR